MQRTLKLAAILLTSAVCLSACGRSPGGGDAAAREVFQKNCASCHGADGEGRPIGSLRAPSFKSDFIVKLSDEQLYNWIARGGTNMPSFKNTLTEEQMRGLVRHIREIQGK